MDEFYAYDNFGDLPATDPTVINPTPMPSMKITWQDIGVVVALLGLGYVLWQLYGKDEEEEYSDEDFDEEPTEQYGEVYRGNHFGRCM